MEEQESVERENIKVKRKAKKSWHAHYFPPVSLKAGSWFVAAQSANKSVFFGFDGFSRQ
jgi:hypothetical protein